MSVGALYLVELTNSSHLPFQRQFTNDCRRNLPRDHMIYTKSPTIPSFYQSKAGGFVGCYWEISDLLTRFVLGDRGTSLAQRGSLQKKGVQPVNRTVLFVSFCLAIITGCAISDNSETESGKAAIATPTAENSPAPILAVSEPAVATIAARGLSHEEIRQLQIRLKELGFDPGPTDGVPGAKTRAAFGRLQASCTAWNSMAENSAQREAGALDRKLPASGKDIQMVQRSLRGAGFDSGPVDGILGTRTKTVLMAVQSTCPKINELANNLSFSVSASEKQKSAEPAFTGGSNAQQSIRSSASAGAGKQTSTSTAAQTNEEIRILQLRLRDAGFDPGPFDGVMGPKTKSALQQYEASQHGKKTKVSLTTDDAASHY